MSTLKISNPRLPLDSIVLVTGVNGLIASRLADELIQAGYRVRGTVRSIPKHNWLVSFFSGRYGPDKFELVEVPNICAAGCFDEAAVGVTGIAHTATYMDSTIQDASELITKVVDSVIAALDAAKKTYSVKAFVLTSSSWAAKSAESNVEEYIDVESWNESAVKSAYDPADTGREPTTIYAAGKVAGERALWKWVEDNEPKFIVNTVLPSTTFGAILNPEKQAIPSTAGFVQMFYNAQKIEDVGFPMSFVKSGWYIDVVDTARLHIAGLVDLKVHNERLFGFAGDFTWDDVLAIFRKMDSEKTFLKDFGMERDKVEIRPRGRAEEVLKKCFGSGFIGLNESIVANVESFTKHTVGG